VLDLGKVIPAPLEFIDIAGLIKGAHKGEGLGNEFLSHIQEVDLLCQVLPFYKDNEDPEKHKETVLEELILKDLHLVNRLLESSELEEKREVLETVKSGLSNEKAILSQNLEKEQIKALDRFNLLTAKKIFYIANIGEKDLDNNKKNPNNYLTISAKTEEDLIDLESKKEREEYREALGIKVKALDQIISKAYRLLNLISFYTIKQEISQIQAWPTKKGTKAREAAGLIHSDFAENFVKAQIVSQRDLIESGSFKKAGGLGLIKIKGENYPIKDGEIINFVTSN